MSSYHTKVEQMRYNAATQSFEALVVFVEGGDVVKYPTSLELPIETDFADVTRKLVAEAKRARKHASAKLVSRTARGQSTLIHLGDLARQLTDTIGLTDHKRAA